MNSRIPSLPSSGASPQGLGANFQPDLSTGTGNYSVAIELPTGQRGFRPDLALTYSSGIGQGVFGQGWTLTGTMTIHVSTKKGVPNPTEPENRTYELSGNGELEYIKDLPLGRKLYRPRTVNHNWWITKSKDDWTIITEDGTRYRLGTNAKSRVSNPSNEEVFEWHLSEIESPTGQVATFHYREFGTGRVLSSISYGPFIVEFVFESRPDNFTNARYGFSISRDVRCRAIDIRSI